MPKVNQNISTRMQADDRKKAMMDAAYSLFIEKGYANVSLDDILKISGGSKATIYKLFVNKEGIMKAVIQSLADEFLKNINVPTFSGQSLKENMRRIGLSICRLALSDNAINQYRLAVSNAKTQPELSKIWFNCGPKTTMDGLSDLLEKEAKNGNIKVSNPKIAANFFLAMLIFKDNMAMSIGAKAPSKKEIEEIVNEAVKVFFAAYGK